LGLILKDCFRFILYKQTTKKDSKPYKHQASSEPHHKVL